MQGFTVRETVALTLNESPLLRDLGLPVDSVYQADTTDSPNQRPFVVIRWLAEQAGVGPVTRRPFDLWWYGEEGSYDLIERLGSAAASVLGDFEQEPTEGGMIMRIHTRPSPGSPSTGRGEDLYDVGYEAQVIPWRCLAVARGL